MEPVCARLVFVTGVLMLPALGVVLGADSCDGVADVLGAGVCDGVAGVVVFGAGVGDDV